VGRRRPAEVLPYRTTVVPSGNGSENQRCTPRLAEAQPCGSRSSRIVSDDMSRPTLTSGRHASSTSGVTGWGWRPDPAVRSRIVADDSRGHPAERPARTYAQWLGIECPDLVAASW